MRLSIQNSCATAISLSQSYLAWTQALTDCYPGLLRSVARSEAHNAFQRVEFHSWAQRAKSTELVHVCFDQLVNALDAAIWAEARGNVSLKSRSLTRALTLVIALKLSVKQEHEFAGALTHFYDRAGQCIVESSTAFDAQGLGAMRDDFAEVRDELEREGHLAGPAA